MPDPVLKSHSEILQVTDPFTQPAFSLANRAQRALWGIVYLLLFRPSPRPLHTWRAFLLRCFGAKVGKGVHVYAGAKIWAPWNLDLAESSSIADGATCYSMAKITLGKRVIISQGSHLCTGTHDYTSPAFQLYALPITVGEDAWVCAECFVGPGVSIGAGAVIAARSVVTKDMPEWMVCAGSPCKPLKPRVVRVNP
jgi:putative colanic acid biosynthesis acetyltransferase WcaF